MDKEGKRQCFNGNRWRNARNREHGQIWPVFLINSGEKGRYKEGEAVEVVGIVDVQMEA